MARLRNDVLASHELEHDNLSLVHLRGLLKLEFYKMQNSLIVFSLKYHFALSYWTFVQKNSSGLMVLIFMCSVELEKQSYCDLKVVNNTEHHVAFKVSLLFLYNY